MSERDREMALRIVTASDMYGAAVHEIATAREEGRREAINSPETADFIAGVALEAAHQVERWGAAHDRGKSAENWFWLIGYLAGKALRAAIEKDLAKALHHTISAAAACANWHAALKAHGDKGDDRDLEEIARFGG